MANNEKGDFKLVIPLDASSVEDFKPEQPVKVLAKDTKGSLYSQKVKLNAKGQGTATFNFSESPGALGILVGPADASDEEMSGLQTIGLNVSSRQWKDITELKLPAIQIKPYYWFWWLRWCRIITIRGRVLCPDGSPVPAAEVCAFDVDRWFIWSNTQQVGCATTDITGAFEIKFRWCCGWLPWWWWRSRIWKRDYVLAKRVSDLFLRAPEARLSPTASNQPTLAVFDELLAEEGIDTSRPLQPEDVNKLEYVRTRLLKRLPAAPEMEKLKLWPWYPWYPWWDCTPDIIFKVTQDCVQPNTIIVDEGIADTRWNISNPLDVTLVANQQACCPSTCQNPPCYDGECLVFTSVCSNAIDQIGGNTGSLPVPPSLEGYLRPDTIVAGTAAFNGDRPFGGIINVRKNPGDMLNVDYYEVEYDDGSSGWQVLPPGAGVTIYRRWLFWNNTASAWSSGVESFPYDTAILPGHAVYESREHFETDGPYSDWWPTGSPSGDLRFWTTNEFIILRLNSSQFTDGTYHFRVAGYEINTSGNLVNQRVLPFCGTTQDNYLVLTFDNRVTDPTLNTPTNPCGSGTVKICTTEPDTDIIAVRVNGMNVDPCDVVDAASGTLEIDFRVHDTSGHLARYWLDATYKENLVVNLLTRPGAVLTPLTLPTQIGPTYGEALAQGATTPHWYGGIMRLTVPANQAFPEPCCYQLGLRAWKRTVVNCNHNYPHRNRSEYTLGVGVCPPVILKETPLLEVSSIGGGLEKIKTEK